MKISELTKLLKANGCYIVDHATRHDEWYSPKTGRTFIVPRHKTQEVPKGTAHRILTDAGLK